MQSRWFDFGGDTIIRADQYGALNSHYLRATLTFDHYLDTYVSHPIVKAKRAGSSQGYL